MKEFKQVVVIPDVHGRTFWKEFLKGKENEQIIFLGDYVDPYPHEGITDTQALENFKEIIQFKKDHPDNTILLFGNHDCSYLYSTKICNCRYSYKHSKELQQLFRDNKDLFQVAYECILDKKHAVFSHAGVADQWIDRINEMSVVGKYAEETNVEYLNRLYKEHESILIEFLADVSMYRGGWEEFGSCVWMDVKEWVKTHHPARSKEYQVFGHTQLKDKPYMKDKIACMDCRQGSIIINL